MSGSERGKLLWRLADLIDANAEELAQLETLDNGKPLRVARASDIPGSAEMFRYMAGWATKLEGTTLPMGARTRSTPTPAASRWASSARSSPGIFRSAWRHGSWHRRSPLAAPASSSRPSKRR